jgi:hypothetical protein
MTQKRKSGAGGKAPRAARQLAHKPPLTSAGENRRRHAAAGDQELARLLAAIEANLQEVERNLDKLEAA